MPLQKINLNYWDRLMDLTGVLQLTKISLAKIKKSKKARVIKLSKHVIWERGKCCESVQLNIQICKSKQAFCH